MLYTNDFVMFKSKLLYLDNIVLFGYNISVVLMSTNG